MASLTNEPTTERIQDWLGQQSPGSLVISDWVTAEFSAALSIKLRMGKITLQERAAALTTMARMSGTSFKILPVSAACFHLAAHFADNYATGLRAADALHLAICSENEMTVCTLDQRLGAAGPALGVPTQLL